MPMSPYAVSKLATEQYAMSYSECYGLPVLPFRFFNVYGPLQTAGHAYAAVVPAFLEAALQLRALPVNGDGEQSRDFTYVGTVTALIARAVTERITGGPTNLAFGSRITLRQLISDLESSSIGRLRSTGNRSGPATSGTHALTTLDSENCSATWCPCLSMSDCARPSSGCAASSRDEPTRHPHPVVVFLWGDNDGVGGLESRMVEAATVLQGWGVEVRSVLLGSHGGNRFRTLLETIMPVTVVERRSLLAPALNALHPDGLVAFGLRASLYARLASIRLRSLRIVDARNGLEAGRSGGAWALDRWTQRFVWRYMTNSNAARDRLVSNGIATHRVCVNRSAIGVAWLEPAAVERDPERVIMVGNAGQRRSTVSDCVRSQRRRGLSRPWCTQT